MYVTSRIGKVVDASKVQVRKVNIGGNTISTPCIDVCKLDPSSGFCMGCARNKEEIGSWSTKKEEERVRIIEEELPERKQYIHYPPINK
ncbi:hypothetical protein DDB_G0282477 [Dictyostelium discoideum AX4]|uniref:DUF1289 domain-containing protein n=1 Tax=Dictyostelium discoideum TaxID=44689 RepID=Q54SG8_DICDI|nr:hypothetical protein DDB_G0282477 [Dictyostelium discoideum AX4]EAL66098.1 hypothetical protein DDB_G0282477 [Dictyostelium discoideum AX4]|eukprot:XP_640071.1 hypothetical protein DDB_G0282477 [Dictyostelium discoideum AX4]